MKPSTLLLTGSLLANLVLTIALLRTPDDDSLAASDASRTSNPATSFAANSPATFDRTADVQLSTHALAQALKSRDLTTLRDQLRALGVPDSTAHRVVRTLLWDRYYERQRELLSEKNDPSLPYWKGLPKTARTLSAEERAELRQLASDARQQTLALLGPDGADATGQIARRYAYLPPEKAAQLVDLQRDYGEMRQEITQESERFRVTSDTEKLKLIEDERRKDIAAMLTPAELDEYDLRHSGTAAGLRNRLSQIDIAEPEYRDLFALQKAYEASAKALAAPTQPGTSGRQTPEELAQSQARRANQEKLQIEIKALLGDARYEAFRRAQDNDYRQLLAASDRFNLPASTIDAVYALRETVAARSQQVGTSAALTPAQKKAELAKIAAETRAQVTARLGPEIAEAYLKTNMRFLERVENGNTFTIARNGLGYSYKSVTPPAPRPAPRPAPKPLPPVESR